MSAQRSLLPRPCIALVGRPNVGKSTLFNALTRSRQSLVSDLPGVTRDRNYGNADIAGIVCCIVDTGGLLRSIERQIDTHVDNQVWRAVEEADVVLFVLDGRDGLTSTDEQIAMTLRRTGKPLIAVVNKSDFADTQIILADFYRLGITPILAISAEHRRGLQQLSEQISKLLEGTTKDESTDADIDKGIQLAVIGRPNAGKSTLLNQLLGEERLIASPIAGTTRDAISIPYVDASGEIFTLIDTAGIRRRARVDDKIEKFSIVKALAAIDQANVVLLLLNAHEGITDQDAHLLGEIVRRGRGLVIAVNKWDGLEHTQRSVIREQLERKLHFIDYASVFYISALYGSQINKILPAVKITYQSAFTEFSTNQLTNALVSAYRKHKPPLVGGKAIKLQYAHQGGKNPPHIIIHGSRTNHIPASYTQYLSKFFRQHFDLKGTPVRISYRNKHNPYNMQQSDKN